MGLDLLLAPRFRTPSTRLSRINPVIDYIGRPDWLLLEQLALPTTSSLSLRSGFRSLPAALLAGSNPPVSSCGAYGLGEADPVLAANT
jgi:hypothetical protein